MKDDEIIEIHYKSGFLDWKSELHQKNYKVKKSSFLTKIFLIIKKVKNKVFHITNKSKSSKVNKTSKKHCV